MQKSEGDLHHRCRRVYLPLGMQFPISGQSRSKGSEEKTMSGPDLVRGYKGKQERNPSTKAGLAASIPLGM